MAIGTTAAILGAAALGTAGSVASGMMGSKAAGQAADAQTRAAELSAQVQRDSITQSRIDAFPWAFQGAQALYVYMDELGIPRPENPIMPDLESGPFAPKSQQSPTAEPQPTALGISDLMPAGNGGGARYLGGRDSGQTPTIGTTPNQQPQQQPAAPAPTQAAKQPMALTARKGFQETPGYQFQIEEGTKGVVNNLSALGMKNSGAALKALTRFRTGLANQEYNNYLNRIAGVAGMGQSQVNTTNALSQNAAGNIGMAYQDAGAARASGYVGRANAWTNALGGMTNTWGNALGQFA